MAWIPPTDTWNDISLTLRGNISHRMTLPEGDGNKSTERDAINWLGRKIFTFPFSFTVGVNSLTPQFAPIGSDHVLTLNIPMASGPGVTAGLISKTDYDKFNAGFAPAGTVDQYVRGDGSIGSLGRGLINDVDHNPTLDIASKILVSPVISPIWTLYKNDGITPYGTPTSTAKNLIVDKGVVGYISATFQYPIPVSTEAVPTGVFGDFGTIIPAPGTPSVAFTNSGNPITANISFSESMVRAKSGFVANLSTGQVDFASGNSTTFDSTSITFQGRGCMIFSSSSTLSSGAIEAVLNSDLFQSGRSRTFNSVTSGSANYAFYVYDAALGNCTSVIQDDALPVFGAFSFLSNVTITNSANYSMAVIVMRSNSTGAFVGNKLAFS